MKDVHCSYEILLSSVKQVKMICMLVFMVRTSIITLLQYHNAVECIKSQHLPVSVLLLC